MSRIFLVGAPMDCGKTRKGCLMGPDAYRTAGLGRALDDLGHQVSDIGNLMPRANAIPPSPKIHALPETIGWWRASGVPRDQRTAAQECRGFPVAKGSVRGGIP